MVLQVGGVGFARGPWALFPWKFCLTNVAGFTRPDQLAAVYSHRHLTRSMTCKFTFHG